MKNLNRILSFCLLFILIFSSCQTIEKEDFQFAEQKTGMTGSMRGLDVVDEDCAWISGSGGEYCFTVDGGESWTKGVVPGADSLDFRDVHAFSETSALLMSAGPGESSRIYRTDDGGSNWKLCFTNSDPKGFFDGMDFLNENEGIMFSDPVDAKLYLLFTIDGGHSWERLDPSTLPEMREGEYAFAASGTGIRYDDDGGIWIATGGSVARIWHGYSIEGPWEITSPPVISGDPAAGLFSIAPQSKLKKIVVGGHYVKMNTTGANVAVWDGENLGWYIPEGGKLLPFMECVRWISPDAAVAAGPPGVYFSADSGNDWVKISDQGFHTFDVSQKGRVGWLALNRGIVMKMSW